jgi:hypothetical protein
MASTSATLSISNRETVNASGGHNLRAVQGAVSPLRLRNGSAASDGSSATGELAAVADLSAAGGSGEPRNRSPVQGRSRSSFRRHRLLRTLCAAPRCGPRCCAPRRPHRPTPRHQLVFADDPAAGGGQPTEDVERPAAEPHRFSSRRSCRRATSSRNRPKLISPSTAGISERWLKLIGSHCLLTEIPKKFSKCERSHTGFSPTGLFSNS